MSKKYLFILAALLAAAACSSGKQALTAQEDDGIVDLGYERTSKNVLTGSVGQVKNKNTRVYNTIYDYFRENVAGVIVESSDGQNAKIYIRGLSTINSPTDPLFIVDGVEVDDISMINPYEVDSVTVLKDTDAAMYGVRGTNGVVIINLKKTVK